MDLRPLIEKKRRGSELHPKEIHDFVHHVVQESTPDYQISTFLMAILWKGLNFRETVDLTREMARHGERIPKGKSRKRIGKHSTGGVGDKTSFLVGPLVASYGVEVPLMSGRGLGHTGGTIDKISGIRGMQTSLHPKEVHNILRYKGFCIFEQTPRLGPADRRLYALRDATGTVESLPLIVASILSKKMLEGLDGLVLDVKFGAGSLMGPLPRARALGKMLLKVARALKLKATVLFSAMEQPLGRLVGNNLEILECLEVLRGQGPEDLVRLTVALASEMLALAKPGKKRIPAAELTRKLISGELEQDFHHWIKMQGGRMEDPRSLILSEHVAQVAAPASGWVQGVDARWIGEISMRLGAGRSQVGAPIDPRVGIILHKKVGDRVKKGEGLADLFHESSQAPKELATQLKDAFRIGKKKSETRILDQGNLKELLARRIKPSWKDNMLDPQLYRERLETSAARFREFFGDPPRLAVVFGSGLGKGFMAQHPDAISLPFSEFPEFKIPQVDGHHARICSVRAGDKNSFLVLQGRVHYYEGYEASEVVFPVRALALWGVKRLLLTNASGSIRPELRPGQLALISDHLNFMGANPLIGPNLNFFGTRFPSLQSTYRNSLAQSIRKIAQACGIKMKRGVYVGIAGPSYETDAEVKAYRRLGGDLIGMSTVLEAIAGTHAGMEVAALAAVTNSCLNRKQPLNHGEVLQFAQKVDRSLAKILQGLLKQEEKK